MNGKVFIREQGEVWIGTAMEGREGTEDEKSCYFCFFLILWWQRRAYSCQVNSMNNELKTQVKWRVYAPS